MPCVPVAAVLPSKEGGVSGALRLPNQKAKKTRDKSRTNKNTTYVVVESFGKFWGVFLQLLGRFLEVWGEVFGRFLEVKRHLKTRR